MKKVISLALCIAMMLCSAFVTSASCEHSYITTEIPATCSERSHTLKTCTICGETEKIYAPLYDEDFRDSSKKGRRRRSYNG